MRISLGTAPAGWTRGRPMLARLARDVALSTVPKVFSDMPKPVTMRRPKRRSSARFSSGSSAGAA